MDWTQILVAAIPAVLSAVVAVITMRQNKKQTAAEVSALKNEMDVKQNSILQLTLRTTIQSIYSTFRGDRCIPIIIYKGACDMFDEYKAAGGNSYIHQLIDEMGEWNKF